MVSNTRDNVYCIYHPQDQYAGSVHCFVPKGSTCLANKEVFSDWKNDIIFDNRERNAIYRDRLGFRITAGKTN